MANTNIVQELQRKEGGNKIPYPIGTKPQYVNTKRGDSINGNLEEALMMSGEYSVTLDSQVTNRTFADGTTTMNGKLAIIKYAPAAYSGNCYYLYQYYKGDYKPSVPTTDLTVVNGGLVQSTATVPVTFDLNNKAAGLLGEALYYGTSGNLTLISYQKYTTDTSGNSSTYASTASTRVI